ncbi:Hydroxyproline-rich glycoprotein family protein [Rhynchospora pubera]|uniref:Hydroxyproline-rich glycoprotein family protein n=1 Tax=Rhynchospora pubera TaxID=906938 RepID=A0AAV8HR50_9POAL|nr:Hydroxyproline-rich glycoprotein family protein [Rhynchospora pubera]KAJ4817322.1 Hydroxyproline-rich glycoprotein family protein [Rhynchospora pubera]
MEDAAKRRERLMALRTEASQSSGAPPPVQPPLGAAVLPDPLFSSSSPAEAPSQPPRFDYYTNPSAAFSSANNLNKRKSSSFHSSPASRPYVRPNYTGPNQPPMHQLGPQFHRPPYAPPIMHWRSPAQFQPPPAGNIHPATSGHGSWQYASGPSSHVPYTNRPLSGFTNPRFVRDSSAGLRPRPNHNMNSYSGTRGTGGRGVGFHSHFGHGSYYSKSMVEDPWIELEPIVGKLVDSHDASCSGSGSHSWLPESIIKKESKKPEIGNKYGKKLSLSEYLDLSFNQTIDEK